MRLSTAPNCTLMFDRMRQPELARTLRSTWPPRSASGDYVLVLLCGRGGGERGSPLFRGGTLMMPLPANTTP